MSQEAILALTYAYLEEIALTLQQWTQIQTAAAGVNVCVPNAGCWPVAPLNDNTNVNPMQNHSDNPILRCRKLNDGCECQLVKPAVNGGLERLLLAAKITREEDGNYALVAQEGKLTLTVNEVEGEQGKLVVGITTLEPLDANSQNVNLTFTVDDDFTVIDDVNVFYNQQDSKAAASTPADVTTNLNRNLSQKLAHVDGDDLYVQIFVQTDALGLNLGEMVAIVNARRSYPGGYPKRDIGKCEGLELPAVTAQGLIQTFYSARPDLSKVLRGRKGPSLYEQTSYINRTFRTGLSDCDFYGNILAYSALKYMFAGLCSGRFSDNWLYSNRNAEFLRCMRNSEFAKFLFVFEEFGLTGYNRYFKSSNYNGNNNGNNNGNRNRNAHAHVKKIKAQSRL